MSKRGERKCVVCGKTYTYCPSCGKGSSKDSYHYLYDTVECREISNTVNKYITKKMSKKLAEGALNVYKVKDKKFSPEYQKYIDEIMAENKRKSVQTDDIIEDFVNEGY